MCEFLKIINSRKKITKWETIQMNSSSKEEIAATVRVKHTSELIKCPNCGKMLNSSGLIENNKVCYYCSHHFRLNSIERIKLTFDEKSIELFDDNLIGYDPLRFPGYNEKLTNLRKNLDINEGVITGKGNILKNEVYFGVMDYRFIMGSMGSAVGEKLTRMVERATKENKPAIIFSASGGARIQEGMISLYQMAKVAAALEKHSQKGLLYISILTDPTTGGVSASFASGADIIIAEPNATVGFAGKRVIKGTINEKVPDDFQTSEFQLRNGHIDIISTRKNLKNTVADIISLFTVKMQGKKYESINIEETQNEKNNDIGSWEKVKLSRHPGRANFQDYINNIFDNFIELHGDRISMDDQAIVTGIGTINSIPVIAVLSAKGKSLDESVLRNFGMARPEGYRKVIRVTKLAEKFGLPVICFIDTPGAYCGFEAEKMGQSEAISNSIRNFTKLTVPIISIITGEGGSGGALAMGVADWIFILENSIYSVISPEGCASILFKDSSKAQKVSEYLKLTSNELLKLKIVDEIIAEPKGGMHKDIEASINYIKSKLYNKLVELLSIDTEKLLAMRNDKFRSQV